MRTLALDFRDALASNDGLQMHYWIQNAKVCGIGSLVRFAFGLQKDLSAVLAAVETPWSNGQVEDGVCLARIEVHAGSVGRLAAHRVSSPSTDHLE